MDHDLASESNYNDAKIMFESVQESINQNNFISKEQEIEPKYRKCLVRINLIGEYAIEKSCKLRFLEFQEVESPPEYEGIAPINNS